MILTPEKIPAIFTPLCIEHEWEGCFVFNCFEKGHCWEYGEIDKWKRLSFKAQKGSKKSECNDKKSIQSLVTHYTDLKNELKTKFPDDELFSPNQSSYVRWLSNSHKGEVNGGLSLVLNALIRQSTVKSFEILFTMVGEHGIVEVRNLGKHVPSWFYFKPAPSELFDESLVCYPEFFSEAYKEEDKKKEDKFSRNDINDILDGHRNFRAKHSYQVHLLDMSNDKLKIILRDRVKIIEYVKGAICNCIPVPGKQSQTVKSEPRGVNSPEVIVSSPIVSKTLEHLSRIWQDPHVKSVLISSPPGSGKENFASSIPYGNGRSPENIQYISMACDDQGNLEKQLYGFEKTDGHISEGLISKAAGSAIFFDEIHQPEEYKNGSSVRSSLLRTLEADAYYPIGSADLKKIDNVLFVMATSKPLIKLAQYKPSDFWTRMTYSLQIPHPLKFTLKENKHIAVEKIVADFFCLFWWNLCEQQYGIDPLEDPNNHNQHLISEYWQLYSMLKVICSENPASEKPEIFADVFASELKSKGLKPHQFSIRGIRNLVTQLFSIAWSNTAQGKKPLSDSDAFKKIVIKLFNEILPAAKI